MASYDLDDIRAAAEKRYASVEIKFNGRTVELLNPLRMERSKREALVGLQERMNASQEDPSADTGAMLEEGIMLVAGDAAGAKALLKDIDGDLAVLAMVFNSYIEGTQAGEA